MVNLYSIIHSLAAAGLVSVWNLSRVAAVVAARKPEGQLARVRYVGSGHPRAEREFEIPLPEERIVQEAQPKAAQQYKLAAPARRTVAGYNEKSDNDACKPVNEAHAESGRDWDC